MASAIADTDWLFRLSVDWMIIKFDHLISILVVNLYTTSIEENIDIRKMHLRHLELLRLQQAKETNITKSSILLSYVQKHVLRIVE